MPGRSSELLYAALLQYAKTPGKYHVALRQPPLLFSSIPEILQLAAGRKPESATATQQINLRAAARFFTKTALLFPDADHYAVLGLDRQFDPAELKERYRLLMRLTHPDFASATSHSWPANAAVRVNLAYEVLSSPDRRRGYDARMAAPAAHAPMIVKELPPATKAVSRKPAKRFSRLHLVQLTLPFGVAALLVLLFSIGGQEAAHLVQRVRPAVVESAVAFTVEPATPRVQRAPVIVSPAAAPVSLPPSVPVPAPPTATATPTPVPPPQLEVAGEIQVPSIPLRKYLPAPAVEPAPAVVVLAAVPAPPPPPPPPPSPPSTSPPPSASPPPPPPRPVPPRPAPIAGLTLAEAQPLLTVLLQHLESGRGERLIEMLDRDARGKPAAQALSRQYDGLVDGMRPVRVSHVEFRAEPADGGLLVIGNMRLHVGDEPLGSTGKKMMIRAEFAKREGAVVMTGLTSTSPN